MARRVIIRRPGGPRSAWQASRLASAPPKDPGIRELVQLDQAPLREREVKRCREALKRLEKARAKVSRFENEEVPKFTRWLNQTFGQELTRLRETSREVERVEFLIERMRDEIHRHGNRPGEDLEEALDELLDEHDQPSFGFPGGSPEDEESDEEEEDVEGDPDSDADGSAHADDSNEDRRRERDRFHDQSDAAEARSPAAEDRDSRIRDRYRALARRLHPDLNPGVGKRELELWHQVQAAYEAGDLEELDRLATLADLFEDDVSGASSISELRRIFGDLALALKGFEREMRSLREHPAWQFMKASRSSASLELFTRTMARDFRRDQIGLEAHLEMLQEQARQWAARARAPERPRPRRRRKNRGRSRARA